MMFVDWVEKGDSMRRIKDTYGYSLKQTHRILIEYLNRPIPFPTEELLKAKYIMFDGKYLFGKKWVFVTIMDAQTHKPIISKMVKSESKNHVLPWLKSLKSMGFEPCAVTLDGKADIIQCFKEVWPNIKTQRCLFHIQMQIQMWSRRPPRLPLGKTFLIFLQDLTYTTFDEVEGFIQGFQDIKNAHKTEIEEYRKHKENGIYRDMIKSISLLSNALDDMFYYTEDPKISPTTSALEGFHKQVERALHFDHYGFTEEHCFRFLMWFAHSRK
jgi:hypothetical protein